MHAYLIMAHDNFEQLKRLLKALDYEDNRIYLHVDLKAENFYPDEICACLKYAELELVKRKNVIWGDYSQIDCELALIEAASKREHEYLHLMSGMDFPIKSHRYIVDFFNKYKGFEFVHFECDGYPQYDRNKIQYWYLFQKYVGKKKSRNSLIAAFQRLTILAQMILRINRVAKNKLHYYKGANWFSITGECARYIVDHKQLIENTFKNTLCGDEFFLQTIIMDSKYKDRLWKTEKNNDYTACLRMIDWERGNPYIFRIDDENALADSECLFARKFDMRVDSRIIDKLSQL